MNENIPIWSVIWFHFPLASILYNYYLKIFLILIILLATSSFNYFFQAIKCYLLFITLSAIRAPCNGGFEYIFLAIILQLLLYILLYLRKNIFACLFIWSYYMKSSDSLSVKAHIFSKWLRNNHLKTLINKISYRPCIFLKISRSKSLISWIKIWNKRILLHYDRYFLPLLLSWINSCWVMSTCMK